VVSKSSRSTWYPYVMAAFAVILVLSNTIAARIAAFGPFVLAGAVILFPISYILGDVVTEVYGYAGARKIFWVGLAANLLMVVVYLVTDRIPAVNPAFAAQFHNVLNQVPRIVVASMVGVWCGQFANAFVMSRMKVLTKSRYLWTRTISSTIVGETIDTAVFATLAFGLALPWPVILTMIWSGALLKTLYEIAATPLTYLVVGLFKKHEGEVVDYKGSLSYNPFRMADGGFHVTKDAA
jgi:queuosine precursor transporter